LGFPLRWTRLLLMTSSQARAAAAAQSVVHTSARSRGMQPRPTGKRGKQPISLSVVFRYHIKPVADRLGIQPAVFGWHTFRRSFASMVVGSTKDVKAAQELMRHSTSKLTLDLYAQALPENKVAASKAIAGSLLLPQFSTCTAVQSGQGPEEPVKLNGVNESPSSSPA